MKSIFQYYKLKNFYSLPYYNTIEYILELDSYTCICVYDYFICSFDFNTNKLLIIDNYNGIFEDIFKIDKIIYILTTKCILQIHNDTKSCYNLEEYIDYNLYKNHILFFCDDYKNVKIYDIVSNCYIFNLNDISFPYVSTLYEDRLLNHLYLYMIYSTNKYKHIYKYDINNKSHEYFSFKCLVPFSIIYNIDDKHLFIKNSCFSFLFDECHAYNKFQISFLNDVIETMYLDEINCVFFRTLYRCFIIHKKHFIKVKQYNLSSLKDLIDNCDLEYSFYFDYDSCKPCFCFVNNIVTYLFKNSLFIYTLLPHFKLLSMKELNYYCVFNNISIGDITNTVYLTTTEGDFYTFNL